MPAFADGRFRHAWSERRRRRGAGARDRHPNLPIILVTGYADTQAVDRVLGGDRILRKPFKVEELASALRRALDPVDAPV